MSKQIALFEAEYEGFHVSFQQNNGYLNATQAAQKFHKAPKDWLKTDRANAYIYAIGRKLLLKENQLVIVRAGAPETGGGTWLHPKLAIEYARWLNIDFALWCDDQIEAILRGDKRSADPRVEYAQLLLEMHRINPPRPHYFTTFIASSDLLYAMVDAGLPFNQHNLAVISIGQAWAKHYVDNNLAEVYGNRVRGRQRYPLSFAQAAAGDLDVWYYPSSALEVFSFWLVNEYLPNKYPRYMAGKVKSGVITLNDRNRLVRSLNERYLLAIN